MKKSSRVLALLLCVVMMATLMPTMALADNETGNVSIAVDQSTVKDTYNTAGSKVILLSKDRYSVAGHNNGYDHFTDPGYGNKDIYMIPRGNGNVDVKFYIERDAVDINRWWRWAKEGDNLSQSKDNDESGYASHSGNPGVSGMTAQIEWHNVVDKTADVPQNGTRARHWIFMKAHNRYVYEWAGGYEPWADRVGVTVKRADFKLGEYSILWSANGTSATEWTAYTFIGGVDTGKWVEYGDLGQNYIIISEPRYVVYDVGEGASWDANGSDTADRSYLLWTTGTASTSQKHQIINDVPHKDKYIFSGWKVEAYESANDTGIYGKTFTAGRDINNGITGNIRLVAQWTRDVSTPDYTVVFKGNGNTNDVAEYTQGFNFDIPDDLRANRYEQVYTVTFNGNGGVSDVASSEAESEFLGWGTSADSGVVYADRQNVVNLTNVDKAEVPLFAKWNPVSIELPNASRNPGEEDKETAGYVFEGWFTAPTGGTRIGGAGDIVTVTADMTLYAQWTPVKMGCFYIYHSSDGSVEEYSLSGLVNTETFEEKDGSDYTDATYITGYKGTFNITDKVKSNYLYGGTFESSAFEDVADFRGMYYNVTSIKESRSHPKVVTNIEKVYTDNGTPMAFHPQENKVYYIWEVSEEHLVPKNISVWSKQNGIIDVTAVYLLTAIDRLNYSAAGFKISAGAANQVSNEGKIAYDYITIWQNNQDRTYFSLYPAATTTENSLIQCCALTGFKDQPITVVPYWVTLDGVKVFGTTQRTITYLGEGHNAVDVKDAPYTGTRLMANAVNSPAPMMLMARYSMANEESFVDVGNLPDAPEEPDVPDVPDVPETAVVNVVDGEKAYEAEIVDGAAAITPAGAEGKLFAGWFTDEACTAPADLAAVNDGDTVYAKYVSASFLKVKYAAVFTLFNKSVSLTAAVADKNFTETGFVIETKNGTDTVVVSSYAQKFALQNAQQLFGVAKDAPLMTVDYKLNGLSRGDTFTVTPYWVTADGTTVYGTARTLTYTGLTVKG